MESVLLPPVLSEEKSRGLMRKHMTVPPHWHLSLPGTFLVSYLHAGHRVSQGILADYLSGLPAGHYKESEAGINSGVTREQTEAQRKEGLASHLSAGEV